MKVVKKLPKDLAPATRAVKHFRSWSSMDYYQEEIASMLEDYQAYSFECFWSFLFLKNEASLFIQLSCQVTNVL